MIKNPGNDVRSSLSPSDDVISDLGWAVRLIWQGRWLIASLALLGGVSAAIYGWTATPMFRSEALVQVRADRAGTTSILGALPEVRGLAEFAGASLGGNEEKSVALATLKSRNVIEPLLEDLKILQRLYEPYWDASQSRWIIDAEKIPTLWDAFNEFTKRLLQVVEDKKTGLITVAVEWKDPVEAQSWVTEVIARTNAHLKATAIAEGEKNLGYLEKQSQLVALVELRQSLADLMEIEHKKLMLARGNEEFAIKTIDPAVVPKRRIRPNRTLLVALGLTAGVFCGAALLFIMSLAREVAKTAP